MASNPAMIGRRRRAPQARHHPGAPASAIPVASTEIDHWLRVRVAPSMAGGLGLTGTTRPRDTVTARARRLLAARIAFIGHPSFDDPAVVAQILGPLAEPDDCEGSRAEEAPGGVRSSGTASAEPRFLTREQEAHLFRRMNFLKYTAARLREAIDPDAAVADEIDRVEALLREAGLILDRIIGSNLALVVSIAKKFIRPGQDLYDLASDGNLSLLRAAERFDFARGFRFTTYASYAIVNDFTRSLRREKARHARFLTGRAKLLGTVADRRGDESTETARRERLREGVGALLGHLNDREQAIIAGRFGLARERRTLMQLGQELGISRERVRQIESRALEKLWDTEEARQLNRSDCSAGSANRGRANGRCREGSSRVG
jgi:RNA polymerase primary sigma factor